MAKKTKSKVISAAPAPIIPPLTIDLTGPTQDRKVKKSKAEPSVFVLDDGTKLIIKSAVVDVKRAVKQFNQQGQPLYFVTVAHAISTDAPKSLLRPKAKK